MMNLNFLKRIVMFLILLFLVVPRSVYADDCVKEQVDNNNQTEDNNTEDFEEVIEDKNELDSSENKKDSSDTIQQSKEFVNLTGMTWIMHDTSIDLGVAYEHDSNSDIIFKWQAYNLDTLQWNTIADWTGSNWVKWRPTIGNYWIHIEAMTQNGKKVEYTYCFRVDSDKSKTSITINGITWIINDNSIDVGGAYSSKSEKIKFKWQAYNLDTKEWNTIADWNEGNWAKWKPKQGNYWLHLESKNNDGGYDEKTICFVVDRDYSIDYVKILSCSVDTSYSYAYILKAKVKTDSAIRKYNWLVYDTKTKVWQDVTDDEHVSETNWNATNGSYLICFRVTTEHGVIKENFFGYSVTGRPLAKAAVNITVGADSSYKTINEALKYAKTIASRVQPVNIIVLPGEYNEFIGLNEVNYVNIIGTDPNTTVVKSNLNYPKGCIYLNGTHNIENISFYASGNAYALHYETISEIIPGKTIIKNCVFKSDKSNAVGVGLSAEALLQFEDCKFISDSSIAIYFHNSAYSNRFNQRLSFLNCEMLSVGDAGILMDDAANSYGNINSKVMLKFIGCTSNITTIKYRKNTFCKKSVFSYIPHNDSAFMLSTDSIDNNLILVND